MKNLLILILSISLLACGQKVEKVETHLGFDAAAGSNGMQSTASLMAIYDTATVVDWLNTSQQTKSNLCLELIKQWDSNYEAETNADAGKVMAKCASFQERIDSMTNTSSIKQTDKFSLIAKAAYSKY